MSVQRALAISKEATVETVDGAFVRVQLVRGWDSASGTLTDHLDGPAHLLGLAGPVFVLQSIGDGLRAMRYRLARRRDWLVVTACADQLPTVARHPSLTAATAAAESELLALLQAGGSYRPYG